MTSPAEVAAQRLSWEMESWRSIELVSHEDFKNATGHEPSEFGSFRSEHRYIETAAGQRRYDQSLVADKSIKRYVNQYFRDGALCANLTRTEINGIGYDQIRIGQVFGLEENGSTCRPVPLSQFYVGLEPLPRALPKAVYQGKDRHLGRECDLFLFRGVGAAHARSDLVYWLDVVTSIPLKVEYLNDKRDTSQPRVRAVWNALSLDEVQGHQLPMRSEIRWFSPQNTVIKTYQYHVEFMRFDQDHARSTFWPVVQRDATVFDTVNKKVTFPRTEKTVVSHTVNPIRAIDPGSSVPSGSLVLTILGLGLLTTGFLLW